MKSEIVSSLVHIYLGLEKKIETQSVMDGGKQKCLMAQSYGPLKAADLAIHCHGQQSKPPWVSVLKEERQDVN